jgi:hypothetical protein
MLKSSVALNPNVWIQGIIILLELNDGYAIVKILASRKTFLSRTYFFKNIFRTLSAESFFEVLWEMSPRVRFALLVDMTTALGKGEGGVKAK